MTQEITVRAFTPAFLAALNVNFAEIDAALDSITDTGLLAALSGAVNNDIFYNANGTIDTFTPATTVSYITGLSSNYMQAPVYQIDQTLNIAVFPLGNVVLESDVRVVNPSLQASFPGYGSLPYAVTDDNYKAFRRTNQIAHISENPLRITPTNTQNVLDVGPEWFRQREVPNAADNSYIGWDHFQASTPGKKRTLGSNPFTAANGTRIVTVSLVNHGFTALSTFVNFETAVTGRGLSFGGTSDANNDYGNEYGAYLVQSTPTADTFTIFVADNASSSGTFGGTGVQMWQPMSGVEANNPFATQAGSATVTVTHNNHGLSNGDYAFWWGGSAVGGVTLRGNHIVSNCTTNTFQVTLNAIQDGAAVAGSTVAAGGGTPSYAYGMSGVNVNAVNYGAQIKNGNPANPKSYFSLGLGSPPTYNGGNDQQWYWSKTGYFYKDRAEPTTPGGINVAQVDADQGNFGGDAANSGDIAVTASISGTTLDVTVTSQINIGPGMTVRGTGVLTCKIVQWAGGGTSGGVGTYTIDTSQTVSSRSMTIRGESKATVVGQFTVTDTPNAADWYDTYDINVLRYASNGAWIGLRGRYSAGAATAAGVVLANSVGDLEAGMALNNTLQTFGPGERGSYIFSNYGHWQVITNYQATARTWIHMNGVINAAQVGRNGSEGYVGLGGETNPISVLTIKGNAGGLYNNWALSQLTLWGSDTNQRFSIGYDTTNDYGVLQAGKNGTGWKPTWLNPAGGGIKVNNPNAAPGVDVNWVTAYPAKVVTHAAGLAAHATLPELGEYTEIYATAGYANRATAYKIGAGWLVYDSTGVAGTTADLYGINPVVHGFGGAGGVLLTAAEFNVNNMGAAATTLGASTAVYGAVAAPGGVAIATAGFWAAGVNVGWQYGFATNNIIGAAGFWDSSNSPTVLGGSGTHTYGIDLSSMTINTAAFKSTGFAVDGSGNVAGASYSLGATALAINGSGYNILYDGSSRQNIFLGGTGDPSNYYRNANHTFQNVGGSATWFNINSSLAYFSIPLSVGRTTSPGGHALNVHAGTNQNLEFRPGVVDTSAITLSAVNDTGAANVPLEILASALKVNPAATFASAVQLNNLLYFNGSAATDVAMRRNSTTIEVVNGNQSDYGSLYAKNLTLTGTLTYGGVTASASVSGTGSLTLGLGDAWTAFTPTITPGGGAFTSVTPAGRYKLVGKTLLVEYTVAITTNGTASGYYSLTLPGGALAQGGWGGAGADNNTGKALSVSGRDNSNLVYVWYYDGTYSGASGTTQWINAAIEIR